jgi:hypothetical protein
VNFLLSEGHAHASKYPLGYLDNEVFFAQRRVNNRIATETTLLHTAVGAVLSKKGYDVLQAALKELRSG